MFQRGVVWSPKGWIVVPCFGGHMKGWKLSEDVPINEETSKAEQLEQELLEFAERERKLADGLELEDEPLTADPEEIEVARHSHTMMHTHPRIHIHTNKHTKTYTHNDTNQDTHTLPKLRPRWFLNRKPSEWFHVSLMCRP